MNRPDYLGAAILAELELRGTMTTPWLAQNLHEKPKAIATSCVALARANKIRSWKTGLFFRSPSGKKTAEVFWELGSCDNPPPQPVRKKRTPEDHHHSTVGIDDTDLEWMERYRQQAAMRREQQRQRVTCY